MYIYNNKSFDYSYQGIIIPYESYSFEGPMTWTFLRAVAAPVQVSLQTWSTPQEVSTVPLALRAQHDQHGPGKRFMFVDVWPFGHMENPRKNGDFVGFKMGNPMKHDDSVGFYL